MFLSLSKFKSYIFIFLLSALFASTTALSKCDLLFTKKFVEDNREKIAAVREGLLNQLADIGLDRLSRILRNPRFRNSDLASDVVAELQKTYKDPFAGDGEVVLTNSFLLTTKKTKKKLRIEVWVIARGSVDFGQSPNSVSAYFANFIAGLVEGVVVKKVSNPAIKEVELVAKSVQNPKLRNNLSEFGFRKVKVFDEPDYTLNFSF